MCNTPDKLPHEQHCPWVTLDVGQDVTGSEAHWDETREVIVLPVSFVPQVKGVKLLQVRQVTAQGRLTHERVLQKVLVVDLIDTTER